MDDKRGLPQKAIEIRAKRELHEMNCEIESVNRRQQFLMEQVQRDGMNDVLAERLMKLGRRRETVQREIEEWKVKYNL